MRVAISSFPAAMPRIGSDGLSRTNPRWATRLAARLLVIMGLLMISPHRPAAASDPAPLVLERTIILPDVSGRIDHLAVDLARKRLFVAALGNDTAEVVDLDAGRVLHRISGLPGPQGIAYSEKADLVFIANAGDGSVRVFHGGDLSPAGRFDLHQDADNIRVDPRNGAIAVGHGAGSLTIIDPVSLKVIGAVALPAHPEGFQIDPATGRAFINIPDANQIAVIDLDQRRQSVAWRVPGLRSNFPLAYDSASGLILSVFRRPPRLVLMNAGTGAVTANLRVCGDADDVFGDAKRRRIYVSCGAGEIAGFQWDVGLLKPLPSLETVTGARTSLFVPALDRLFLAVRAAAGQPAAIRVYRPVP